MFGLGSPDFPQWRVGGSGLSAQYIPTLEFNTRISTPNHVGTCRDCTMTDYHDSTPDQHVGTAPWYTRPPLHTLSAHQTNMQGLHHDRLPWQHTTSHVQLRELYVAIGTVRILGQVILILRHDLARAHVRHLTSPLYPRNFCSFPIPALSFIYNVTAQIPPARPQASLGVASLPRPDYTQVSLWL
jgi:hypothetical protein